MGSKFIVWPVLAFLIMGPVGCGARSESELIPTQSLDLQRMYGRWYIIANIPYSLERGVVGSYVDYVQRSDGDIDEFYSGHAKSFSAKLDTDSVRDHVISGTQNATWRGDFLWPFFFHTTWIYVDPEYQVALLGYQDRSLGWIFSRKKTMDNSTYENLLQRMAQQKYDTTKFRRVPQLPDQIGAPGFQ
jgi:apolipoprotein D and lipocalin family protein